MIIENYKAGKTNELYDRYADKGRMLPPGVEFINSWIEEDLQKCYQVMKSETREALDQWIDKWKDLVYFEVIPVLDTQEASKITQSGSIVKKVNRR